MPDVEFVATACALELSREERYAFEADLRERFSGGLAWFRVDDGGRLPKRALRGRGFTLYFADPTPERSVAYRVETGLSAGDCREWIPGLAVILATWGGRLRGVYRDVDGANLSAPPELLAVGERGRFLGEAPADALPHLPAAVLKPTPTPRHGDVLAERAADPSSSPSTLSALLNDRRLAPYLVGNPSLTKAAAERLLELLLRRGPWDCIHPLARHPAWGSTLPAALRRAPFADLSLRRRCFGELWDEARPLEERARALERLLGWSCEVDVDSLNVAPWLPFEAPEEVIEAFLAPAFDDADGDDLPGEDFAPADDVVCWSAPPLRPSAFQRLLAAWRHPPLAAGLRRRVGAQLGRARLSAEVAAAL